MDTQKKNIILSILMLCFLVGMGGWFLGKKADTYSDTERRTLEKMPELSMTTILSGKFMNSFEAYALDQFPIRDAFRSVKAISEHYVLQKMDSNGLYSKGGYLSKLEYPLNDAMLQNSADHFEAIYKQYLEENNITPYFAIVPDKNYFLASESGRLSLDYNKLYETMQEKTDYMQYIEIADLLELSDYYKTDTHWKQECVVDVAERIGSAMGADVMAQYETNTLTVPFQGVYVGQAALPVKADTIKYMTNDVISSCIVTVYDTGKPVEKSVYTLEKADSKDAYEIFLNGASALITIENPNAATKKELVIFRDSFGSSLTPLLIEGYCKITLVDIRYIQSGMLGSFITFDNQDVLFLYSTLLLNNSLAFK